MTLVGAEKRKIKDKNIKIIKQVNNDKKLEKYMTPTKFSYYHPTQRVSSGNLKISEKASVF